MLDFVFGGGGGGCGGGGGGGCGGGGGDSLACLPACLLAFLVAWLVAWSNEVYINWMRTTGSLCPPLCFFFTAYVINWLYKQINMKIELFVPSFMYDIVTLSGCNTECFH